MANTLFEWHKREFKLFKSAIITICLLLTPWAQAQQSIRLKARGAVSRYSSKRRQAGVLPHHYVLEFRSYPGPETRQELGRRGIRVLQYLPDLGLMVSSDAQPDLAGLEVTWAGALDAGDKISPLLQAQSAGAYLVVFQVDSEMQKARETVRSQGLDILENPALLAWQLLVTGDYRKVTSLAANDAVAYVMPASPDLVAGAPVTGCAGPLTEAGPVGEYVEVGNGWARDADGGVALHYFFQSLTQKLDESTVRGEIERAFREWARYANLTLSPGQQEGAVRSIDILFARGSHGDGYPFDGRGGILAHTFYPAPPNSEPMAGDMHLDADEDWHAGTDVDLYTVALHEAGHALGLGHSDRPGAVMYPYYRLGSVLTDDDIAGIRALYGSNSSTPAQPPVPPVQPPVQPPVKPPVQPPVQPPVKPPVQPPVTPGADTTPPSLTITSPGSTMLSTSSASIAISGTASDNAGVTAVKWTNSFGDGGTASGTAIWSVNVPLLTGNNAITIRAFDAAGNSGWRAITIVKR